MKTTVTLRSPEAFGHLASSSAGFHIVEVIASTCEVILAATLQQQQSSSPAVVCVHCKIAPGLKATAQITARSTDPSLAEAALSFLTNAAVTSA
jgi:hypothetical protein